MTIRPFDPSRDYPAIVAIFNANFPAFQETASEFEYGDNYRDKNHHFARVVGEVEGRVVGYGESSHNSHGFHPQKFTIDVLVDPSEQGKGYGKTLYASVVEALAPLEPITLRSHTCENLERSLRFLTDRGYTEEMRFSESWLDVAAFDPSRFAGVEDQVLAQGIQLVAFSELDPESPESRQKLYELAQAVQADIPSPEPFTGIPYEVWEKRFAHSGYLPQGHFIAIDGDQWVGISTLWGREADNHLQTGATGVLRSHRRRKIALALKLRALAFAKAHGAPIIRTDNESNNVGMLSINIALGFEKQPGWVLYSKALTTPESAA